jgi:hypothetical protein
MHLAHVVINELDGSDLTGIGALLGGLLLVGLAGVVAWRSRGGGTLQRRIGRRALVALGLA